MEIVHVESNARVSFGCLKPGDVFMLCNGGDHVYLKAKHSLDHNAVNLTDNILCAITDDVLVQRMSARLFIKDGDNSENH